MDEGDGDGCDGDGDGDNTSWWMRPDYGGDCELCGFFRVASLGWHGCLHNLY